MNKALQVIFHAGVVPLILPAQVADDTLRRWKQGEFPSGMIEGVTVDGCNYAFLVTDVRGMLTVNMPAQQQAPAPGTGRQGWPYNSGNN